MADPLDGAGDTGWHDHDISAGAVHVLDGALSEANPRSAARRRSGGSMRASRSRSGPSTSIASPASARASLSLHAYSPPLWRMGQYTIDERGVKAATPVSYAEELRPLEQTVAA